MEMVILIAAILLAAGFIKGFSGFATSIILSGFLFFYYDPILIVPVLALISFCLNILILIEHAKYIKNLKSNFAFRPETLILLIIGIFLGAKALLFFNPNIIKIVFALAVVLAVYLINHKISEDDNSFKIPRWESNAIIGFISGFFSGMINVNGPPALIYGLYHKYNKIKLLKSVVVFYLIADLITLIIFWLHGMYSVESIILFLWFIPAALIGFFIGMVVRVKTSNIRFKKYVIFLILMIAVKMFIESVYKLIYP